MDKKRVYVDGFMVYCGWANGCSVAVIEGDCKQLFIRRYLLKQIKNKKFKKLSKENPVTNFVVEYFAIYMGLRAARKYNADIMYSDSEIIVKQLNGEYMVHNIVSRYWFKSCRKFWRDQMPRLKILWISRKKMVEILGH